MRKPSILVVILAALAALSGLLAPATIAQTSIIRGDQFVFGTGTVTSSRRILTGTSSPEGAVTAPVGTIYIRTDGGAGTSVYFKESGTGNTGWVAGGSASSSAPIGATYITQTADGSLTAEQALSALATGYMKVTTGTGVVSSQATPIPTADGGTGQNSTATFPTSGVVATDVNTLTFTNKTLSAEGTGNVVTTVEKELIRAARCDNATASSPEWSFPTTNPAVPACVTGTNVQKGVLDFADGANSLSAQTLTFLPTDWTGAIDVRLFWFTAAITGNVVWQVATICVADAETGDPAFNTASTVTDTAKGTTLQFNEASITGVTATGCAAGEVLHLKVFRDPAHASDTLANTARLVAVELTTRRAQ